MKAKERIKIRERRREEREKRALDKAWTGAEEFVQPMSITEPGQMASSVDASERLLALMLARRQIRTGVPPGDFFQFARRLITDRDNNCRWQAVIVVGESIDSNPDAVWNIVAAFGDSRDDDMRSAIACVLLEHLLDTDFDRYFSRVQDEVRRGRLRFLDTLAMCWFDDHGPNYERAQRYVRRVRRLSRQ